MSAIRKSAGFAVALLASVATAAIAQDTPPTEKEPGGDSLTVVVGGGYVPSYEGSDDMRVIPAAAIRGKVAGLNFFTRGTSFYLDGIPSYGDVDLAAGPVVNFRLDRTSRKGIKDRAVRDMGKLDMAVEAGVWAGIAKTGVFTSDYDVLSFRVAFMQDMAQAHDSYVITPSIEYATPLSTKTLVGLSVSGDYVGRGYGRYYYNVNPAQALASGLPVYTGASDKAGWKKVNAGLLVTQSLSGDLTQGLSLVLLGGYSRILGDYADSPIVRLRGDRDQWSGGLGLAYTF